MAMRRERPAPGFFLLLMAAVALLLFLVVAPLATDLFLAIVFAAALWPLQEWLVRKLKVRRGAIAGVLTIGLVILAAGPLSALIAVIIRDGSDAAQFLLETVRSPEVADIVASLPEPVADFLTRAIDDLPRSLDEVMAAGAEQAKDSRTQGFAVGAVSATGVFVFHAVMTFIALFFLLVHGKSLVHWLDSVSPLRAGQTHELLGAFRKVSFSVIVSSLITAAVQALAALIGYLIARVPSPIFFASLTFFLALIPAVGAAVVVLVAALLLFLTGHPYMAIFLAAWGIVVVGLVDNVVKPLLIKRGMEIHEVIVFFSLVGGLAAFGAVGLLVGPLTVAMALALIRMYHRDYSPQKQRMPSVPGIEDEAAGDEPSGDEEAS